MILYLPLPVHFISAVKETGLLLAAGGTIPHYDRFDAERQARSLFGDLAAVVVFDTADVIDVARIGYDDVYVYPSLITEAYDATPPPPPPVWTRDAVEACTATLTTGLPCLKDALPASGLCSFHTGRPPRPPKQRCKATLLKGTQCTSLTDNRSGYCNRHAHLTVAYSEALPYVDTRTIEEDDPE